ncbi:MAG: helix-turn-helix transcriptional regulator [Clostridiales bacterium]|nr:helix-turn-helix transcriptional regulator [Clostridiales bacterium]
MPVRETYTKKLCMTELCAEYAQYCNNLSLRNSHYFDADSGRADSCVGYIVKGILKLKTIGKILEINEGSLFYLPEGIRYNATFEGSPEIEFYNLRIISKRPDAAVTERYSMMRIDELSTLETGQRIADIYRLISSDERVDKVRAIGLYYSLYADILPHLQSEPPIQYNPAVISAIEYIEANFTSDFSMETLAQYCCVSVSRLHHLFRSELGTTPIKYRSELRIEKAVCLLRDRTLSLGDIAERSGFNSPEYFREQFRALTGLTPSEYRGIVGV